MTHQGIERLRSKGIPRSAKPTDSKSVALPDGRGRHGGGLQSLQHQAVTRGSHQNPAGCRGGSAEIIQTLPTDGRESLDDVRLPAAAFTQVEWLCGMRTQAYRGKRTE